MIDVPAKKNQITASSPENKQVYPRTYSIIQLFSLKKVHLDDALYAINMVFIFLYFCSLILQYKNINLL
jgi:hypothetical protein